METPFRPFLSFSFPPSDPDCVANGFRVSLVQLSVWLWICRCVRVRVCV